jgi:hypothetical protein
MASANFVGAMLFMGTAILTPIALFIFKDSPAEVTGVVLSLLFPGLVEYGYAREALIGKINVHQDVGEWFLGGLVLNAVTWLLVSHAAIWIWGKFKEKGWKNKEPR